MKTENAFDIHAHITDHIVAAIEAGAGEWAMPWRRAHGALHRPKNVASGALYQGVNILSLWISAEQRAPRRSGALIANGRTKAPRSAKARRARRSCSTRSGQLSRKRARCPTPKPSGLSRASLNRANPRAARLIRCPGVESTSRSIAPHPCAPARADRRGTARNDGARSVPSN